MIFQFVYLKNIHTSSLLSENVLCKLSNFSILSVENAIPKRCVTVFLVFSALITQ